MLRTYKARINDRLHGVAESPSNLCHIQKHQIDAASGINLDKEEVYSRDESHFS